MSTSTKAVQMDTMSVATPAVGADVTDVMTNGVNADMTANGTGATPKLKWSEKSAMGLATSVTALCLTLVKPI